jgi:hypothetical protein
MIKTLQLFVILIIAISFSGFAQDAMDNETNFDGNFTYQVSTTTPQDAPAAVLYDNGPAFNVAGGGPVTGSDLSLLENTTLGNTTLGFGHALSSGFRIADQFEVPAAEIWTIDSIWFYAYQTNGGIPSTINFVSCAIWDDSPDIGTIVWGDQTTDYMTYTDFSNIYRHSETSPGTTRAIMVNTVTVGAVLGGGIYWLDWQSGGTAASGPWAPPIAILGQAATGDALQYNPGTTSWGPAMDTGGSSAQGFPFVVFGSTAPIPVELTSFAAVVQENDVVLNWSTATETNNQGFEVQRSSNTSEFVKVGYVAGHGTVTEAQSYTFSDKNLEVGSYSYRLKQVDFDGAFEYSNVVVVEVIAPDVYALEQNYPNPFNPSTSIKFSLAVDSKVTLTVFDVLGQEVVQLLNSNVSAGVQNYSFDASGLNSGVYFYRIDATGIDGTNFSSIKKMMLAK